jgi:hypothetical protein
MVTSKIIQVAEDGHIIYTVYDKNGYIIVRTTNRKIAEKAEKYGGV